MALVDSLVDSLEASLVVQEEALETLRMCLISLVVDLADPADRETLDFQAWARILR